MSALYCDHLVGLIYLGEGLAEEDLVALLDEVSDGEGVLEDVSGGESLVCLVVSSADVNDDLAYHVEEWEVLLLLADVGEFLPLSLGRVDTSGILVVSHIPRDVGQNIRGHKHVAR